MHIRIFFIGLFFLNIIFLSAQNETFVKANNAYNSADFKTAIELYKGIIAEGLESPDLYLNLGNAYLKQNNLGGAILSFEKGLKMDGDHNDLTQNLMYANKLIATQITAIPDFFLSRYWNNMVSLFGSTSWAVVQIILFALIAVALGFWLLGRELHKKKIAFYSMICLSFIFLIAVLAGMSKYNQSKTKSHAIVIANSTELLSSASDQSELLFDLSEGNKVKIIDEIGEFYKVELIDKEVGWIVKEDLEEI